MKEFLSKRSVSDLDWRLQTADDDKHMWEMERKGENASPENPK